MQDDLIVITGTHGVLELDDGKGNIITDPIYLDDDLKKVLVPR